MEENDGPDDPWLRPAQPQQRRSAPPPAWQPLVAAAGIASACGGIGTSHPPRIKDAQCVEGCLDLRKVVADGRGRAHRPPPRQRREGAAAGREGGRRPASRTPSTVVFKVPEGAETGKPVAIDRFGGTTPSRPSSSTVGPRESSQATRGIQGPDARRRRPRKAYFGGKRRARSTTCSRPTGRPTCGST